MAETIPSPSEKTVLVPATHLNRLWTLVVVSLVLNALIIMMLVVGAIIHHHRMNDRMAGGRGFGGHREMGFRHDWRRSDQMAMHRGWRNPNDFRGGSRGDGNGRPGMMNGAQSAPPDPARMGQDILDHLSQKLELTDDEKARIKPIIDQQVADIQKQMAAQRASIQKQLQDAKAKIKPLLTPDQQKQLDALPVPGQKPPGQ